MANDQQHIETVRPEEGQEEEDRHEQQPKRRFTLMSQIEKEFSTNLSIFISEAFHRIARICDQLPEERREAFSNEKATQINGILRSLGAGEVTQRLTVQLVEELNGLERDLNVHHQTTPKRKGAPGSSSSSTSAQQQGRKYPRRTHDQRSAATRQQQPPQAAQSSSSSNHNELIVLSSDEEEAETSAVAAETEVAPEPAENVIEEMDNDENGKNHIAPEEAILGENGIVEQQQLDLQLVGFDSDDDDARAIAEVEMHNRELKECGGRLEDEDEDEEIFEEEDNSLDERMAAHLRTLSRVVISAEEDGEDPDEDDINFVTTSSQRHSEDELAEEEEDESDEVFLQNDGASSPGACSPEEVVHFVSTQSEVEMQMREEAAEEEEAEEVEEDDDNIIYVDSPSFLNQFPRENVDVDEQPRGGLDPIDDGEVDVLNMAEADLLEDSSSPPRLKEAVDDDNLDCFQYHYLVVDGEEKAGPSSSGEDENVVDEQLQEAEDHVSDEMVQDLTNDTAEADLLGSEASSSPKQFTMTAAEENQLLNGENANTSVSGVEDKDKDDTNESELLAEIYQAASEPTNDTETVPDAVVPSEDDDKDQDSVQDRQLPENEDSTSSSIRSQHSPSSNLPQPIDDQMNGYNVESHSAETTGSENLEETADQIVEDILLQSTTQNESPNASTKDTDLSDTDLANLNSTEMDQMDVVDAPVSEEDSNESKEADSKDTLPSEATEAVSDVQTNSPTATAIFTDDEQQQSIVEEPLPVNDHESEHSQEELRQEQFNKVPTAVQHDLNVTPKNGDSPAIPENDSVGCILRGLLEMAVQLSPENSGNLEEQTEGALDEAVLLEETASTVIQSDDKEEKEESDDQIVTYQNGRDNDDALMQEADSATECIVKDLLNIVDPGEPEESSPEEAAPNTADAVPADAEDITSETDTLKQNEEDTAELILKDLQEYAERNLVVNSNDDDSVNQVAHESMHLPEELPDAQMVAENSTSTLMECTTNAEEQEEQQSIVNEANSTDLTTQSLPPLEEADEDDNVEHLIAETVEQLSRDVEENIEMIMMVDGDATEGQSNEEIADRTLIDDEMVDLYETMAVVVDQPQSPLSNAALASPQPDDDNQQQITDSPMIVEAIETVTSECSPSNDQSNLGVANDEEEMNISEDEEETPDLVEDDVPMGEEEDQRMASPEVEDQGDVVEQEAVKVQQVEPMLTGNETVDTGDLNSAAEASELQIEQQEEEEDQMAIDSSTLNQDETANCFKETEDEVSALVSELTAFLDDEEKEEEMVVAVDNAPEDEEMDELEDVLQDDAAILNEEVQLTIAEVSNVQTGDHTAEQQQQEEQSEPSEATPTETASIEPQGETIDSSSQQKATDHDEDVIAVLEQTLSLVVPAESDANMVAEELENEPSVEEEIANVHQDVVEVQPNQSDVTENAIIQNSPQCEEEPVVTSEETRILESQSQTSDVLSEETAEEEDPINAVLNQALSFVSAESIAAQMDDEPAIEEDKQEKTSNQDMVEIQPEAPVDAIAVQSIEPQSEVAPAPSPPPEVPINIEPQPSETIDSPPVKIADHEGENIQSKEAINGCLVEDVNIANIPILEQQTPEQSMPLSATQTATPEPTTYQPEVPNLEEAPFPAAVPNGDHSEQQQCISSELQETPPTKGTNDICSFIENFCSELDSGETTATAADVSEKNTLGPNFSTMTAPYGNNNLYLNQQNHGAERSLNGGAPGRMPMGVDEAATARQQSECALQMPTSRCYQAGGVVATAVATLATSQATPTTRSSSPQLCGIKRSLFENDGAASSLKQIRVDAVTGHEQTNRVNHPILSEPAAPAAASAAARTAHSGRLSVSPDSGVEVDVSSAADAQQQQRAAGAISASNSIEVNRSQQTPPYYSTATMNTEAERQRLYQHLQQQQQQKQQMLHQVRLQEQLMQQRARPPNGEHHQYFPEMQSQGRPSVPPSLTPTATLPPFNDKVNLDLSPYGAIAQQLQATSTSSASISGPYSMDSLTAATHNGTSPTASTNTKAKETDCASALMLLSSGEPSAAAASAISLSRALYQNIRSDANGATSSPLPTVPPVPTVIGPALQNHHHHHQQNAPLNNLERFVNVTNGNHENGPLAPARSTPVAPFHPVPVRKQPAASQHHHRASVSSHPYYRNEQPTPAPARPHRKEHSTQIRLEARHSQAINEVPLFNRDQKSHDAAQGLLGLQQIPISPSQASAMHQQQQQMQMHSNHLLPAPAPPRHQPSPRLADPDGRQLRSLLTSPHHQHPVQQVHHQTPPPYNSLHHSSLYELQKHPIFAPTHSPHQVEHRRHHQHHQQPQELPLPELQLQEIQRYLAERYLFIHGLPRPPLPLQEHDFTPALVSFVQSFNSNLARFKAEFMRPNQTEIDLELTLLRQYMTRYGVHPDALEAAAVGTAISSSSRPEMTSANQLPELRVPQLSLEEAAAAAAEERQRNILERYKQILHSAMEWQRQNPTAPIQVPQDLDPHLHNDYINNLEQAALVGLYEMNNRAQQSTPSRPTSAYPVNGTAALHPSMDPMHYLASLATPPQQPQPQHMAVPIGASNLPQPQQQPSQQVPLHPKYRALHAASTAYPTAQAPTATWNPALNDAQPNGYQQHHQQRAPSRPTATVTHPQPTPERPTEQQPHTPLDLTKKD